MNKRKGRKRRSGVSKTQAQRIHAKKAAWNRYGVRLNRIGLRDITDMIQNGRSEFVSETSNRVTIHIVTYRGARMRVVYDRQRNQPVTFLPLVDKR